MDAPQGNFSENKEESGDQTVSPAAHVSAEPVPDILTDSEPVRATGKTADPVIIQFDEDDSYFMVTEMICYNMGLKLTATASSINASRDIIQRIEQGKLKPDIAIIADFLGYNFEDGPKLVKKLKEIAPHIKIIAFSTDSETNWGDYLAIKSGKNQSKTLVQALTEITGKEFKASNITNNHNA